MDAIKVQLLAQDPAQLGYLQAALQIEAPSAFQVHCGLLGQRRARVASDLVILEMDATVPGVLHELARVLRSSGTAPVVVVSRWNPGLDQIHQLMRAGADDVLVLAELTAQRLAAALLKTLERRARWNAPPLRKRRTPTAVPTAPIPGVRAAPAWTIPGASSVLPVPTRPGLTALDAPGSLSYHAVGAHLPATPFASGDAAVGAST